MTDAPTATATSTTPAIADGDASPRERDARLFNYKRAAAEDRLSALFGALEAGDAEGARQEAEDLLYTIRRAATLQGIGLNVRLAA